MRATADIERWEDDGGQRRACLDTVVALSSELGLRPWETKPVDVDPDEPPSWIINDADKMED
jgi:hypothetical protein